MRSTPPPVISLDLCDRPLMQGASHVPRAYGIALAIKRPSRRCHKVKAKDAD